MVRESNVKSYHCSELPGRETNFSITPVGSADDKLAGNSISDDPVSEMALNLSMLVGVLLSAARADLADSDRSSVSCIEFECGEVMRIESFLQLASISEKADCMSSDPTMT